MESLNEIIDDASEVAEAWLNRLSAALHSKDPVALGALFEDDCYWRDMVALSRGLHTFSGHSEVCDQLLACAQTEQFGDLSLDRDRLPPAINERAGRKVIEAVFHFKTRHGEGIGMLRLSARQPERAWTLMTSLDQLRVKMPQQREHFTDQNWAELREQAHDYSARDPQVLVVGAGHAGLSAAAELGQLGIDTLVIDREQRAGDNWRLRYHNLSLHNQINVNHLPYLPFPRNWPRYIPKDKLANWLEIYVEAMEINLWLETGLTGAEYDEDTGRWRTTLRRTDGTTRELHPAHIVMATSVSGPPKIAPIPTLERFTGTVQHSSEFEDGAVWRDHSVLVFGTGTSAHDVAFNLSENGARVTMVQRSPTMVLNMEPSAQLYDSLYLQREGLPLADRDLIASSMPFPLIRLAHQKVTEHIRELDADLHRDLEAAGFRLEFGEDNTGWPLKYRTRGGGYYFNSGASDRIIDGRIGLIQYKDIDGFNETGVLLHNSQHRSADLVVLATGYHNQESVVKELFGEEIAARVGPVWGLDERQELRNMWTRTAQTGLWFTAGSFAQCRVYSKYLAQQIAMFEYGLLD